MSESTHPLSLKLLQEAEQALFAAATHMESAAPALRSLASSTAAESPARGVLGRGCAEAVRELATAADRLTRAHDAGLRGVQLGASLTINTVHVHVTEWSYALAGCRSVVAGPGNLRECSTWLADSLEAMAAAARVSACAVEGVCVELRAASLPTVAEIPPEWEPVLCHARAGAMPCFRSDCHERGVCQRLPAGSEVRHG